MKVNTNQWRIRGNSVTNEDSDLIAVSNYPSVLDAITAIPEVTQILKDLLAQSIICPTNEEEKKMRERIWGVLADFDVNYEGD